MCRATKSALFNHLVGAQSTLRVQFERLGGLEVDRQPNLVGARLKVGRLGAP